MSLRDIFTYVAEQVFFDNSTNGYAADNVQGAIEEVGISASPGFSFGRSGNIPSNTWLNNEGVPSNKAGRYVYINNAEISRVFVSNEKVSTFDVEVFSHDGNEVNLTSLGTVSVVADRGDAFTVSWAVATDKQLAIKVSSGSAKNLIAGLELKGNA